jgi:6-phosphogluconolactonase
MAIPEIKVVPDPQAVATEAAARVVAAAEAAIALHGHFSIALSGGSTPKAMFAVLAAEPLRSAIDWAKVHVFWGDERCVGPDHEQSNYRMAREALLAKVPVPGDNIYRMRGELDPREAAREYDQLLQEHFPSGGVDLNLLGMGDDGHTASLFPGTEALKETQHRCVANFVPKLNSWRLTMTATFINESSEVMIVVAGAGKAQRVASVLEGPRLPDEQPIQRIAPLSGKIAWILDAAAASMSE